MTGRNALRAILGHRALPLALAAAATLLVLPSLWAGLQLDDYVLLGILRGTPPLSEVYPSRLDIFNFFGGSPERMRRMVDLGLLPWWTYPSVSLAFWRPVPALTHWIDHVAWPDVPAAMHAHSLLWFACLVVAVALLYRQMVRPAWAAGLAALFYALDGTHAFGAIWLAYRNALVATLFAALALRAHDRWRREGRRESAFMAPVFFLLALLSSEGAAALVGYLVAHAIFLERAGPRGRLRALAPCIATLVAWQVVYGALGYGARAETPGYVSPAREPLAFLQALVWNAPIMLLAQWGGPSADGTATTVRWLASCFALAIIGAVLAPLLRRDAVARFWGLGQLLALSTTGAVLPSDRYLFFVGLGAMGLAATFLAGLADTASWRARNPAWRVTAVTLAAVFGVLHLAVAPWHLHRAAKEFARFGVMDERLSDSMPADPGVKQQILVIPTVPSSVSVAYSFYLRTVKGQPIPAHTRLLAAGTPVELRRPDARTVIVRPLGQFESTFRSSKHPLAPHTEIVLPGTRVEVPGVGADGWPTETVFRFDVPLEDSSLRWIRWERTHDGQARYVPFTPPPIGGSVRAE